MNGLVPINIGVCGRYRLEAFTPDEDGKEIPGTRRVAADWFDNLITDQGLNYIGSLSTYLTYCQVGTGSAAPANSDTALQSYLAATNTLQDTSASSGGAGTALNPYYVAVTRTYRFSTGAAAGNVSEVGISIDTGSTLFSRALVLDGAGNPTTITVLSTEVLDVIYEYRCIAPSSDSTGTITISGSAYDYTIRASSATTTNTLGSNGRGGWGVYRLGSGDAATMPTDTGGSSHIQRAYDGSLGSVTASPSGSSSTATVSTASYGNNNLYREGTQTYSLSQGNFAGGIDAVKFCFQFCAFQIGFVPAIPKTSSQVLELTFRITWSRATI